MMISYHSHISKPYIITFHLLKQILKSLPPFLNLHQNIYEILIEYMKITIHVTFFPWRKHDNTRVHYHNAFRIASFMVIYLRLSSLDVMYVYVNTTLSVGLLYCILTFKEHFSILSGKMNLVTLYRA